MKKFFLFFLLCSTSLILAELNASAAIYNHSEAIENSHFLLSDTLKSKVKYISTNFENASQLDWEIDSLGIVNVSLIYDHERDSPNRANGHWHFKLEADSGEKVTLVLKNFENVWNGKKGIPVSEKTNCLISEDGKNWSIIQADFISGNRARI